MSNERRSIAIIGSGNWGSTVGKLVAENVKKYATQFSQNVNMYVYEEQVNGQNLSEIINTTHENVKYLKSIKLPENLIAQPDILKCVKGADILFLVLPFQFMKTTLESFKDHVKPSAYTVTLAKGVYYDPSAKDLILLSQLSKKILGVPCYSMMGANIANEVAAEQLCETTIGCDNTGHTNELSKILQSEHFLTQNSPDIAPVEMLGALKNVYAFGYGILGAIPGVTYCTLVVLTRMAMIEMLYFIKNYCTKQNIPVHDLKALTLHSCSFSDLFASSLGGRNARMGKLYSEDYQKSNGYVKTVAEYEAEHLNGQKIQGTLTAQEIYKYLEAEGKTEKYPLLTKIHEIAIQKAKPEDLLEAMKIFPYTPDNI